MAKYSADFKLKVVQYAAQNCLGARALSKIYGVNISSLRYWIKHYQCHGEQAFAKKRRVHSAEFKYQAVMHMRKNQMSLRETTVYFNLGDSTSLVRTWERLYDIGGLAALEPRPKGPAPKMKPVKVHSKTQAVSSNEELAQLRRENEYLRAENEYLKKLDALLQQKESTRKTSQLPKKKHK